MKEQPAIQLNNLRKTFGRRKRKVAAVRGIDLTVPAGLVYGFLGPNGAGKSTTIRMIMDLIRPSAGEVLVYGRNVQKDHAILRRVGALVEGAAFYGFLTGRRNLEVLARTGGAYDARRIQTLLEQVGLADRADRLVKGYSTGMKQRLGLAAALLNDPDLVILDEPTNGLDPAGIQEMRGFIRDLADEQGKTVFLSSHLLGEVEQVCDRVAIINQGEIVSEGRVADLLAGQSSLLLDVGEVERATAVLQSRWQVSANGKWLAVMAGRTETPELVQLLVAQNVA
ncbi:MAG TPA: ABC transporter ATP-binding protein, partial [Anaerolineae bacterium]|nr:ABC transporter ATP-binding protein [Anaerolineae bacterium]